ncbi:MAG TPA: peptide chain release factor N(5)-glutamine methyltransferase [Thermoanaerobaculia bacterium]
MTRLDALRTHWRTTLDSRDVDVLLADHLGRTTAWIFGHGDHELDAAAVEPVLRRRAAGEPLQYIRGRADFFGREFFVDPRVLIPRPETELLVEAALARAAQGARVVDIGTGSGCIAVTMERERPDLHVVAVDRSPAALAVAKRNNDALGANVRFAGSDLLDGLNATFDLIVSNPPYIPAADVETLDAVVRDHEPRMALTPGPRGTEIIERILAGARRAPVLLEIGYGQEADVRAVAAAHGYVVETVIPDLAAIPRVVVLSAHGD